MLTLCFVLISRDQENDIQLVDPANLAENKGINSEGSRFPQIFSQNGTVFDEFPISNVLNTPKNSACGGPFRSISSFSNDPNTLKFPACGEYSLWFRK